MLPDQLIPHEGYAPVKNLRLYYREIGQGPPIILIHGGPDFDHTYLLPDMDRLADYFHLIYYDQRGRGLSAGDRRLPKLSIETEIEDLEGLRSHLRLDTVTVSGHSWGGNLALEYAMHHPDRVSHLILLNTCIATHADYLAVVQERAQRIAKYEQKLNALRSSAAFIEGDPPTVAEYYRTIFSTTIKRPENVARLDISFPNFSKEDVLRARQIEDQLYGETWRSPDFNIEERLKSLRAPTLIIHGDYDFVPMENAVRMSELIPDARLVVLKDCGHFAYLESPDEVRQAIADFIKPSH